ncbi:type II secretion system protein [Fructilactobacillus vespulae]|uniref:prepilin-type N-terminal cleavage/methylation domain-containing protein n=1 Tax=Fructilactobacillus vespulae TaxID=1249630 RepID=UPI0039B576C1
MKITMLSKGKKQGFTLVESLVVLAISAITILVIIFSTAIVKQNSYGERVFWNVFNEKWNGAIQKSRNDKKIVRVEFSTSNRVIFSSYDNRRLNRDVLPMPQGLKTEKWNEIVINEDGYVKPQTVVWFSENSNTRIWQKFQLGWGTYNFERKKFHRSGYSLIDTLIGFAIICFTVILYLETSHQFNLKMIQSNQEMILVREKYDREK